MSIFLEHLFKWNMPNCAEQVQIQKYKRHEYKTPKTACVQTFHWGQFQKLISSLYSCTDSDQTGQSILYHSILDKLRK